MSKLWVQFSLGIQDWSKSNFCKLFYNFGIFERKKIASGINVTGQFFALYMTPDLVSERFRAFKRQIDCDENSKIKSKSILENTERKNVNMYVVRTCYNTLIK